MTSVLVAVGKKILEAGSDLFKFRRDVGADVHSAAASALSHLRGVRNAPSGDSKIYNDEKRELGADLNDLIKAAGRSRGRFDKELRLALRIQDAVVIQGTRDIDPYITELEPIVHPDAERQTE